MSGVGGGWEVSDARTCFDAHSYIMHQLLKDIAVSSSQGSPVQTIRWLLMEQLYHKQKGRGVCVSLGRPCWRWAHTTHDL